MMQIGKRASVLAAIAVLALSLAAGAESASMRRGIDEYRAGNYEDAADHLSAALSTDFNDPSLHYYLGTCYVHLNQPESATREFRITYALQPDGEVGRYAKQALDKMGVEIEHHAATLESLFVKQPPKPLAKIDPRLASLDPKILQILLAQGLLKPVEPPPLTVPYLGGTPPHSNSLPAIAEGWRTGKKFPENNLPDTTGDGPWFQIPFWFAGTWQEAPSTVLLTHRAEFDGGKNSDGPNLHRFQLTERWGEVLDHKGAVWEHPLIPGTTQQQCPNDKVFQILFDAKPFNLSDDLVCLRFQWITFTVSPDQKIKCTSESEQITTITPAGANYCQKNDSVEEFNQFGQARRLYEYRSYSKRIAMPRFPVRSADRDYLSMFRQYAAEHHMKDIVP
jgi:hypothetical protein